MSVETQNLKYPRDTPSLKSSAMAAMALLRKKIAFTNSSAAYDNILKQKVAIKKIYNIFDKGNVFQKRILREIRIMKQFRNHPNIISLIDLIPPRNYKEFSDVYIVMEFMESDLKSVIRSKTELPDKNIAYFLYQILAGIAFLHSANVLHRDIKPENILINKEMEVKLCDFGLSRSIENALENAHATQYVTTRFYRSPELLLYWGQNTPALDIWSVGCIFAEMMQKGTRHPIFPGKDYKTQLTLIIKQLGTPKEEEIKGCDSAKKYLKTMPEQRKREWKAKYPNAHPDALDLLEKMLKFDPTERISAEEALKHPYLKEMYDPEDEQLKPCHTVFEAHDEGDDKNDDPEYWKKLLYDEIMGLCMTEFKIAGDAIVINGEIIVKSTK